MGWIRERILSEHKKYYRNNDGLDWALLAEKKILSTIKSNITESKAIVKEYDLQTGEIEFSMTGELIPVEILEDVVSGDYFTNSESVQESQDE